MQQYPESAATPGQSLVLVHGRGWKPDAEDLVGLWCRALQSGLQRDFGMPGRQMLDGVSLEMAYYGDLCNAARTAAGQTNDAELDLADRRNALARLETLRDFKAFRRRNYEDLPGRSTLDEFLARLGAPLLDVLRLSERAISRAMPDATAYFDDGPGFRDPARERLAEPLTEALARGDRILLISHGLGSVIAWDVLWQLAHDRAGLSNLHVPRIDTWISLGSPLGDRAVRSRLAGAGMPVGQRFPSGLINWFNVSAYGDFTCHAQYMSETFETMLARRMVSQIRDYRIYNLAVRFGRAHAHLDLGYLVHPRVSKLVYDWLSSS